MQHDEMIWQVINHQFCSFKTTIGKAKSDKTHFCKHPYSVTGLCNRTSCPLANSKYATIREEKGRVHLFIKTVERAHSPKNLWEKILLSRNYSKALTQLDEHLAYFPKVLVHRNKQRLTKIHQYLIRMRKIKLKEISGRKAKMVGIHRKIDQREERRERKALVAAKLEKSIQNELVERLAKGTYEKALQQQKDGETEREGEEEEEEEATDEETDEEEGLVEYVEDFESDEEDMEEDMEDIEYNGNGEWGRGSDDGDDDDSDLDSHEEESSSEEEDSEDSADDRPKKKKRSDPKKKKASKPVAGRRKGTRVEIEYEEEREDDAMPEAAKVAW